LETKVGKITCVSQPALRALAGDHEGETTLAVTNLDVHPASMKFDRKVVCDPVAAYWNSAGPVPRLTPERLRAILIVAHEAAHARGIRNEARAECAAVGGALGILSLNAVTGERLTLIRRILLHDFEALRPPAYKLRGQCAP
jgi:hypothetical protein